MNVYDHNSLPLKFQPFIYLLVNISSYSVHKSSTLTLNEIATGILFPAIIDRTTISCAIVLLQLLLTNVLPLIAELCNLELKMILDNIR